MYPTASLPATTDVLIVGAGPTGLTLACALAQYGIATVLIDKKNELSVHSKATNLQAGSMEIFDKMGIGGAMLQQSRIIKITNFYDEQNRLLTSFDYSKLPTAHPYLLMIPQSATEQVLANHLQQLGRTPHYATQLIAFEPLPNPDDGITALLQTPEQSHLIQARYIIGCEGAHSLVRQKAQIPFEGTADKNTYLVADVAMKCEHSINELHGWFHPEGILGIGAFRNGIWRIFADLPASLSPRTLQHPQDLQYFLHHRTGNKTKFTIDRIQWFSTFQVQYRLAAAYQKGNAFLAGDAAHIHSPIGGQGMNMGIHDAYHLAQLLRQVIQEKAPTQLLNTYETIRRPIAQTTLKRIKRNTQIFTTKNPIVRWTRNTLCRYIFNQALVQRYYLTLSAQLKP